MVSSEKSQNLQGLTGKDWYIVITAKMSDSRMKSQNKNDMNVGTYVFGCTYLPIKEGKYWISYGGHIRFTLWSKLNAQHFHPEKRKDE